MKRLAIIICILLLALAGCAYVQPALDEPTDEPTAVPTATPDPLNDHDNRCFGSRGNYETSDYRGTSYAVETDGTIYYSASPYSAETFIHYLDKATGETGVLCKRDNCHHLGYECGAYNSTCLQYYDGKLYYTQTYVVMSRNVNTAVFRMDVDGSNVELVRMLKTSNNDVLQNEDTGNFIMHRGRFFVFTGSARSDPMAATLEGTVYLMELGKNDGERNVLFSGQYPTISTAEVFMYDDLAYIAVCGRSYADDETVKTLVEVVRVELDTGNSRVVFSDSDAVSGFSRNLFVDRDGTLWFAERERMAEDEPSGVCIYRSDRGKMALVRTLTGVDSPILSENIYGGLSMTDGGADILLCDFAGNTLYKGRIDLNFPELSTEDGYSIRHLCGAWGDGTELLLRFAADSPDGTSVPFMVRLEISASGLKKSFLPIGK